MSLFYRQSSHNLNTYITGAQIVVTIDIDELPPPPPPPPPRKWCCPIDVVPTTDEPSSGCCLQEARKACCIWIVYCLCVCHFQWLLKLFVVCAGFGLPILEIVFLLQQQEDDHQTHITLMTDAVLSIVVVFCAIVIQYVMYVKTFRNVMLTRQDNDNRCFCCSTYATYLCVLAGKSALTSTGLSFLTTTNTITNQPLLAINITVLLGQCVAMIWCFFQFLHHYRRN